MLEDTPKGPSYVTSKAKHESLVVQHSAVKLTLQISEMELEDMKQMQQGFLDWVAQEYNTSCHDLNEAKAIIQKRLATDKKHRQNMASAVFHTTRMDYSLAKLTDGVDALKNKKYESEIQLDELQNKYEVSVAVIVDVIGKMKC